VALFNLLHITTMVFMATRQSLVQTIKTMQIRVITKNILAIKRKNMRKKKIKTLSEKMTFW
jgi:hypothetical protein